MNPALYPLLDSDARDEDPNYPYYYGWNVLEALEDKYPRATEILWETLRLDRSDVVFYFCHDQNVWNILKWMVKYLDKASPRRCHGPVDGANVKLLLRLGLPRCPRIVSKQMNSVLTNILKDTRMNSQGSSKGSRSQYSAGESLPFGSALEEP